MKRKFFTTLALFCSLALVTGCGTKQAGESKDEGEISSEVTKNTSSRNHTHKWVQDESKTNVPATCSQEGIKYEKCECGETRETKISKIDHSYGEWVDVAGVACGERGQQKRTCTKCGAEETRNLSIIPHNWEVTNTVAGDANGVEYNFVKCSKCNKEGLMVAASKATINGSDKGGAPEGCIKLASNGQTMSVTINLATAKTGTIYLRGAMDYWHDGNNNNESKMYSSCKNSNTANFSLSVNDVDVDFTDMLNVPFSDMLPEEAGETVGSVTYSQIGDCKVGACSLNVGLNTIIFTRVDSYNLAVHDFLVVFDAAAQ